MTQARITSQQHSELQRSTSYTENYFELDLRHRYLARSRRSYFLNPGETGSPGPDGPEYPPELALEGFSVVGVLTRSVKVSADSRDVACSNLSSFKMGTMLEDRCLDASVDFERANDLRSSSLIAARC
ncbi:MAG: hypothetical protein ACLPXT_00420 [Terracidiphilus sp.]